MAGRPVWPGIFPGARLKRAHKAKIIETFDTTGAVKKARSVGSGAAPVEVDIMTDKGELLMGAYIHFVIENRDPRDGYGWVGVYATDLPHAYSGYNMEAARNAGPNDEIPLAMERGVHPFGHLGRRDYDFFGRLAGVRRDGPEPNGLPDDLSTMSRRFINRWEGDGHSHCHFTLREFVKRKVIGDNTISEATKYRLQGGDPINAFLGDLEDESFITLDENTRVIVWFDN